MSATTVAYGLRTSDGEVSQVGEGRWTKANLFDEVRRLHLSAEVVEIVTSPASPGEAW